MTYDVRLYLKSQVTNHKSQVTNHKFLWAKGMKCSSLAIPGDNFAAGMPQLLCRCKSTKISHPKEMTVGIALFFRDSDGHLFLDTGSNGSS